MRPRLLAALLAISTAAASSAWAGGITLPLNHTVRLPVTGPAASVVVGNPNIADVSVVDSHTVFAVARGYGSTDVTVIDALGRTVFSSQIDVAAPAQGRVALYRGAQRSDLSCDPGCSTNGTAVASPYQGSAPSASSGGSSVGASSALAAGLVAGALMGAARPPFAGGGSGGGGPR